MIDEIIGYDDPGNLAGDQFEARVGVDRGPSNVDSIGRVVAKNGDRVTDIDVETADEIIEVKNRMFVDDGQDQLRSYARAHDEGAIDLNEVEVTFASTNRLSQSQRSRIRNVARDIERTSGNGIDDVTVSFDVVSATE